MSDSDGFGLTAQRHLRALDEGRAELWLADLAKAAEAADAVHLSAWIERRDSPLVADLAAIMDLSPHLNAAMLRRPGWLEQLFETTAEQRIRRIVEELLSPIEDDAGETALMTRLREAKAEACLLIALRDLLGEADARRTTLDLSDLAEAAVRLVLRFCLLDLHRKNQLVLPDPAHPEEGCGLFVLAMGKLGGRELNYSSDIDLILLFDPDCPAIADKAESVEMFSRLARRLVRMIGERTRDGYVFRTDLRLRPDPSAMPLAIPVPTAIVYYESAGRDWERAAMIKARPIAGDEAAAAEFLGAISPFVWRRYLDFVAVRDIQSMKERIDRHRGFEGIAMAGHNVKLGRGGIREIEFFAQTQQLIAGGRAPELRSLRTDEALHLLAKGGWIDDAIAREMTVSYWFLRRVEHVLQMIADDQTHTMPEVEEELLRVPLLCGYADLPSFRDDLLSHLRCVEKRFEELFSGSGSRDRGPPSAAVTGVLADETDPGALEWLSAEGFMRPRDVARIAHGWGSGRYRALRSEAARERMKQVLPALLSAFSAAKDPDAAIASFDRFLSGLPAGVQFFALVASNPKLLDLLALVITASPRLTETIARRPHVFDALLDPAFYGEVPNRQVMAERLAAFLHDVQTHEDRLDRLRIFNLEQKFLIGVRLLSGAIEGEEAGEAFTHLAETVIESLLLVVEAEFVLRHGRIPGGRLALLGLGRLGSGELTATSDVDLILFYDHHENAEESDGDKPLPVPVYYARLTQRLIAALTAPMAEGVLYEVDFRLRPSGNKGPLATQVGSFRRYQQEEAWTWEHMALTRARPIAGDPALMAQVADIIVEIVTRPRDLGSLGQDVADMRRRLEREKPMGGPLDLKVRPGGVLDLEFLVQWAMLSGQVPAACVGRPTGEILEVMARRGVFPTNASGPFEAMRAYTRIVHLVRLGSSDLKEMADLPRGLAERIARAVELPDPGQVEAFLNDHAEAVRGVFRDLLPLDAMAAEKI